MIFDLPAACGRGHGGVWEPSWGPLGASWAALGALLGRLESSGGTPEAPEGSRAERAERADRADRAELAERTRGGASVVCPWGSWRERI